MKHQIGNILRCGHLLLMTLELKDGDLCGTISLAFIVIPIDSNDCPERTIVVSVEMEEWGWRKRGAVVSQVITGNLLLFVAKWIAGKVVNAGLIFNLATQAWQKARHTELFPGESAEARRLT